MVQAVGLTCARTGRAARFALARGRLKRACGLARAKGPSAWHRAREDGFAAWVFNLSHACSSHSLAHWVDHIKEKMTSSIALLAVCYDN